jgi:hypothetical protein
LKLEIFKVSALNFVLIEPENIIQMLTI